jgi:CheY-like chemotaxis protein
MSILIVDDEEVLQDVLSSLLRKEGYDVLSARSGEEVNITHFNCNGSNQAPCTNHRA